MLLLSSTTPMLCDTFKEYIMSVKIHSGILQLNRSRANALPFLLVKYYYSMLYSIFRTTL